MITYFLLYFFELDYNAYYQKKKKRKITNCFMTGDINELGLNSTAGDRSDPTTYEELW